MARWFLILALVATIVACPFRCGGAFGVSCAAESACEPASCSCDCCRQELPSSHESGSGSPLPEPCCCGSCVCKGAVVAGQALSVSVDEGEGVPLFAASPPRLASAHVVRSYDFWNELDPEGRTLRLLRQSFQI